MIRWLIQQFRRGPAKITDRILLEPMTEVRPGVLESLAPHLEESAWDHERDGPCPECPPDALRLWRVAKPRGGDGDE